MVNIIPINVPEERLVHDLLSICWPGTKTLVRLASEEFLQDGDGVARHVDWVEGLVGENGVVDLVFVFTAEWGLLEEHLVDEHSESPPIDGASVLFVEQDLLVS